MLKLLNQLLIIGDSNLSKIPPYTNPEIQIDSYPGANFLHMASVLDKMYPNRYSESGSVIR